MMGGGELAVIVEEIKGDTVFHYSDNGKYIKRDDSNLLFMLTEDVYPCPYEYTETDEVPEEETLDAEDALSIITGEVTE